MVGHQLHIQLPLEQQNVRNQSIYLRRHHHKYPMDCDRLVFPPAAAAIVISLFYWLLHALLPMVRAGL